MSRVVFFGIPAWGHTNPTVEVVRELTRRGCQVRYYSFTPFREKLTEAGAEFVSCDGYLPPDPPKDLEKRLGKDFSALVGMTFDTTMRMDAPVCGQLREWQPDCLVADSVCFWGKLFAKKLGIPLVCSTTTFAFNRETARLIRRRPDELIWMLRGLPLVRKKTEQLRCSGYKDVDLIGLLQNDNETDTIVYTSRAFQPLAETFSDRYAFVGPVLALPPVQERTGGKPLLYVSLGTVIGGRKDFFRSCVLALTDSPYEAVFSLGEGTAVDSLGQLPDHIRAFARVDQLSVLRRADVFLTHCGMNSASEAIACGVPTVLAPQQSEEDAVARRMEELGVGVRLGRETPERIRAAVDRVLSDGSYAARTRELAESFRSAGGAAAAADKILSVANRPSL